MQRLIDWYKRATEDGDWIPALDGLRALMVFLVAAFHIWQQSWLTPTLHLFGRSYSLDFLLRSGYIWVDGMLLLSGFLLYLPHAEAKRKGAKAPDLWLFYWKRLVRIVPSMALCVLVMLVFSALPGRHYRSFEAGALDVLSHLTFTHTFFPQTYWFTGLNTVLWTLGVEMQFYLIFPLLARWFRRYPVLTYLGLAGTAFAFRAYAASLPDCKMWFNQLPAFLDVYANGFVAASCYAAFRRQMKDSPWLRILMSAAALMAVSALIAIAKRQAASPGSLGIRLGQMRNRFPLSAALSILILGLTLGLGGVRLVFGNRVTRFLSRVSFQFYIWHQVFAVWLRAKGIPFSASLTPHIDGDRAWQLQYVLLCFLGALLIASAVTCLFEQPIARWLNATWKRRS